MVESQTLFPPPSELGQKFNYPRYPIYTLDYLRLRSELAGRRFQGKSGQSDESVFIQEKYEALFSSMEYAKKAFFAYFLCEIETLSLLDTDDLASLK